MSCSQMIRCVPVNRPVSFELGPGHDPGPNLSNYPFFYGWSTVVDLRAAKARITSGGRTLNTYITGN